MNKNRRPTIIDVAREAGVSKSTVSLVLRNSASVREKTRAEVRAAMARLGYVYNRNAAQMRTSNTGLVGLVINDLRNPFFTEFAISLQMALAEQGYSTVVANTDETPALQAQVVGSMIEHGVSAFIICPTYGDSAATFDPISRANIPAIQVLRKVDDRLSLFPFYAPEYLKGIREATRHLVEMGARRIAFAGGLEGRTVTEERKTGYFDVLTEMGMEPLMLTGRSSRDFGRELAHRVTREHPEVDAAICFNDLVALGMISGFLELGREVGKEFRLVGFDDIQDAAQSYPTLSSVRCDITRIGSEVAGLVVGWLADGQMPAAEMRTAVTLSIRQSSTGVRPA